MSRVHRSFVESAWVAEAMLAGSVLCTASAGAQAPVLAKAEAEKFPDVAGPGGERGSVSGVYLIEPNSKQKFTVVRDERRRCVCSHVGELKPKSTMVLWAKFPAPGADADKISIPAY